MAGSTIVIEVTPPGGSATDITSKVQFRNAMFESQIGAMPGTFNLTVNDQDQTLTFETGSQITLTVDSMKLWGGYILNVNRKFATPAVDTTTPANVKLRQWELSGVDYNILFDKRIIHNSASHLTAFPYFGLDKTMGWLLLNQLFPTYLDIGDDGLTYAASPTGYIDDGFVPRFDADGNPDPDGTKDGTWPQQGSLWRAAMDDFAQYGTVYYIDASKNIHFHELEEVAAPWGFSDKPNRTTMFPMREFEEVDDASGMINDAFVWGGSEWAGAGQTVFKRSQNTTSIATHNVWQMAETRFGDLKDQGLVTARANVIVSGNTTGAVGGDTSRGLAVEQHQIRCSWFAHDVPTSGGVKQHLRPSQVVPFTMYVLSEDGINPLEFNLPLRSIRISFPNLDPDGDAYVRFDGYFAIQLSDPWWLWKYLRDIAPKTPVLAIPRADGSTSVAVYGMEASLEPTPATNGMQTVFSIPFAYIETTMKLFRDGALVASSAYTMDGPAGTITFTTAPLSGTNLWVWCNLAGGIG